MKYQIRHESLHQRRPLTPAGNFNNTLSIYTFLFAQKLYHHSRKARKTSPKSLAPSVSPAYTISCGTKKIIPLCSCSSSSPRLPPPPSAKPAGTSGPCFQIRQSTTQLPSRPPPLCCLLSYVPMSLPLRRHGGTAPRLTANPWERSAHMCPRRRVSRYIGAPRRIITC
jgi:hypothetical protein